MRTETKKIKMIKEEESEGTEMRRRRRVSVAGDSLGRSSLAALLVLYTFFVGFG